jgi:hypothetical protein
LLAADGRRDFSERAIAEAIALSQSGPIAVVTIARIYGTQFGIPNPGLMPTKQEMKARHGWVGSAVDQIVAAGVTADGQVSVTRKATKSLARVARARGAKMIVIDETPETGIRRFVEGDVGTELRKKLRKDGIEVHVIPFHEPALSSV